MCGCARGGAPRRARQGFFHCDAAQAVGLPAARFRPHSLRIGGASALYHATGEIETVKRYGRWTSGAFHSYLWDSAEQAKGLAARMAADVATIHYT